MYLVIYFALVFAFMGLKSQAASDFALLGVNLGSRFISVTYFNATGPVPLARLSGNNAYQLYMQRTLPVNAEYYSPEEAREMLVKTLIEIRDEARAIIGDPLRIGAISYPSHFTTDEITTVLEAGNQIDENFNYPTRVRPSHYGAMLTYPPTYCLEKWGEYGPIEDDPMVLFFEHDFGRLRVAFAEVGRWGTSVFNDDNIPWPMQQQDLEEVVRKQLLRRNLDEIVAVVVSKDDAQTDLSIVRSALEATFPELLPKLQRPVLGTEWAASVGIACIARQIVLHPRVARDLDPAYSLQHDEI